MPLFRSRRTSSPGRDGDRIEITTPSAEFVERSDPSGFPAAKSPLAGQRLGSTRWVHANLDRVTRYDKQTTRLLIVHVPKTGGTSLRKMLGAHVEPSEVFLATGKFEWFEASMAELAQYKLFTGHNFLEPLYMFPDDRWVTALAVREPLDWWTSRYKYRQRGIAERGRQPEAHDATFDSWLSNQADPALSNPQVSWLFARARMMFDSSLAPDTANSTVRRSSLDGDQLAELVDRLVERISVVGTTDDLLGLYERTCAVMGWSSRHANARRDNTSDAHPERLVLSDEQRDRLLALNRLDARLYEHACRHRDASRTAEVAVKSS